jgi:hypothetical protein
LCKESQNRSSLYSFSVKARDIWAAIRTYRTVKVQLYAAEQVQECTLHDNDFVAGCVGEFAADADPAGIVNRNWHKGDLIDKFWIGQSCGFAKQLCSTLTGISPRV